MTPPSHDSTAAERLGAGAFAPRRSRSTPFSLTRLRLGVGALVATCLGLAALSLLFPSTPTYDPWAWLIWGREIASGHLSTVNGPSWKPLPVAFTAVFSLAGGAAPALWLVVARTGGLLALVMSFRVARRLGGVGAGLCAAVALALVNFFLRSSALGDSEGLLVALVLGAVELHLVGRRRDALLAGFAGALLRPEVWPFLGLYGLWLAWREPARRPLLLGLGVALPLLWFGPELWGSGDALRASARAKQAVPGLPGHAAHPIQALADTAWPIIIWPVRAAAPLALVLALFGRRARAEDRTVLWLGAATALWLVEVGVMTQIGYSGNLRYLLAPAALVCVLGGVGVGRLLALAARGGGAGRFVRVALVAGALGTAIVLTGLPPANQLGRDLGHMRAEAELHSFLPAAIATVGGREAVLRCGTPVVGPLQVTPLAWHLHARIDDVDYLPHARDVVFLPQDARAHDAGYPAATIYRPFTYRQAGSAGTWRVLTRCGS